MAGVPPHPSTLPPQMQPDGRHAYHPMPAGSGPQHPATQPPGALPQPQQHQHQQQPAASGQSAEFFLSNYRLGKTLGIGSFGKVRGA